MTLNAKPMMNVSNGQLSVARAGGGLLDLYAAGLSTLCLLHCLALPLLASLLPLVGQWFGNEFVHRALVLAAAPATFWVAWRFPRTKGNQPFLVVAFSGLGLLLLVAFVDAVSAYEQPITVAGALLLASAHLSRWAGHRRGALPCAESSESDDLLDG